MKTFFLYLPFYRIDLFNIWESSWNSARKSTWGTLLVFWTLLAGEYCSCVMLSFPLGFPVLVAAGERAMCLPALQATCSRDRTDISLIMHTLLHSDPASLSRQIIKGNDINSMTPASIFNLEILLPCRLDQDCFSVHSLGHDGKVLPQKPTETPEEEQIHTSKRHVSPSVTQPVVGLGQDWELQILGS